MALTEDQVKDLYANIVRREPNAHELAAGLNSTDTALTNTLISQAQADVVPFIYLYQAAFNRIPDAAGLDYWVSEYRSNFPALKLWDYTAKFVDSDEWEAQFDDILPQAKIEQLYQNVLGRSGDAEGIQFWTEQLVTGQKTLTDILYDFSQSVENKQNNGASAANLLAQLGSGDAELGTGAPLSDFAPADPVPGAAVLTTGVDVKTLAVGQEVVGSTTTYTDGDAITGTANNTATLTLNGAISYQGVLENVDNVVLRSQSGTEVNTSGWTGTKKITLDKVVANVALRDLQSSDTLVNIVDANKADKKIELTYDAQGISENGANIGVRETFAAIKLGVETSVDAAIKTINVAINDVAGKNSTLADLEGHKTETLNFTGGFTGGKFTIVDALDETLTKIDASTVKSDLDLDTSKTFTALQALLGEGNDVLKTGDTLGTGDVYDGGAGNDRIVTDFASINDPNRTPTIRNVETLEASFQAAVQLNGTNIDKNLATIDLNASAARADFNFFNNGLKTVNVKGAAAQGLEVDYDGKEFAELTVNFSASAGNAGNKAALRAINADTVAVNFLAGATLANGIQIDDDFSGRFTEKLDIVNKSTGNAVVGNHFGTAVVDGNTVKEFTVKTEKDGDLQVGSYNYAALAEATKLQHLVVEAASNSIVDLGAIGTAWDKTDRDAADDLETVVIKAADFAEIRSYGIDADDSNGQGNSAATVTSLDVTGGRSSRIELNGSTNQLVVDRYLTSNIKLFGATVDASGYNWLQAASIGVLNIDSKGVVDGSVTETATAKGQTVAQFKDLIGLDLEAQSNGVINVKSGQVTGFWFEDEVVSTIDASGAGTAAKHFVTANGFDAYFGADVADAVGLTNQIDYSFAVLTTPNADAGFSFNGSAGNDYVVATHAADVLKGNAGNDFLIGNGGNDVLEGGEGADILVGDSLEATHGIRLVLADVSSSDSNYGSNGAGTYAVGNDTIDGGAGNDIIIGGGQLAGGRDILTGGSGNDKFVFNFDANHQGAYSESGKSTLQNDVVWNDVITDFTTAGDQIVIDVTNPVNDYVIAVFNGQDISFTGNLTEVKPVTVILRVGQYNEDGSFNYVENGPDVQALFRAEGELFAPSLGNGSFAEFVANQFVGTNGGSAYNYADHEIALLGAAKTLGSLDLNDIVFV
ncbi:MAG: DUF4214 domain-containing protein [Pseudochelatococcus sp.]|uniref:DUF4214 domain-containing protein n=1 Tax=Pseudochelatococcus sp. TaxID=2020869 RepID=UPI003D910F85